MPSKPKKAVPRKIRASPNEPATAVVDAKYAESQWQRMTAAVVVFAVVLRYYAVTLHSGTPPGDSGELLANACQLGAAHPPGYPLFVLLTRVAMELSQLLPDTVDDIWRKPSVAANMACAIFAAVATVMCMFATCRLARAPDGHMSLTHLVCGCFSGLMLGFSRIYWQYAVGAEVFALNNLLAATLLYLTIRFTQSRELWVAYAGALIWGLGMSNQHTIVLLSVPCVLWVLWTDKARLVQMRPLLQLAACFILGLTPYVQTIIGGMRAPRYSWGNTASIGGFLTHLFRKEYGTFQMTTSAEQANVVKNIAVYLSETAKETRYVGLILAIVAACLALRERTQFSKATKENRRASHVLLLCGLFCFYVLFFNALANIDHSSLSRGVLERFWMQPNQFVFILGGVGLARILVALSALVNMGDNTKSTVTLSLAIIVTFGSVFSAVSVNYARVDASNDNYTEEFGRLLIESLPRNSLFLTVGDLESTSVMYVTACEHVRPDVDVIDMNMMRSEWFTAQQQQNFGDIVFPSENGYDPQHQYRGYDMAEFLGLNYPTLRAQDRIVAMDWNWHPEETNAPQRYRRFRCGPYIRVYDSVLDTTFDAVQEYHACVDKMQVLLQFQVPDINEVDQSQWQYQIIRHVYEYRMDTARWLLEWAGQAGIPRNQVLQALQLATDFIHDELARQPTYLADHFPFARNLGYQMLCKSYFYRRKWFFPLRHWEQIMLYCQLWQHHASPDSPEIQEAASILREAKQAT